jgi:hypothetical protein
VILEAELLSTTAKSQILRVRVNMDKKQSATEPVESQPQSQSQPTQPTAKETADKTTKPVATNAAEASEEQRPGTGNSSGILGTQSKQKAFPAHKRSRHPRSSPSCSETEGSASEGQSDVFALSEASDGSEGDEPLTINAAQIFKKIRLMTKSSGAESSLFGALAPQPQTSESPAKGKASGEEAEPHVSAPVLRVYPALGGAPLTFPVVSHLTIADLKDYIMFALSIPLAQQILTFSREGQKSFSLSALPDATRLVEVPGLVDDITGTCMPVTLVFKMNSGMDTMSSRAYLGEEGEVGSGNEFSEDTLGLFEAFTAQFAQLSGDQSGTGASTSASAKVLVRSLSKSANGSASASGAGQSLYEVLLPESGVKLIISAVINPVNAEASEQTNEPLPGKKPAVPHLVITPAKEDQEFGKSSGFSLSDEIPVQPMIFPDEDEIVAQDLDSLKIASPSASPDPKPFCAKCRIRCRPALRFICKCGGTFCQSHRYPDMHACSFDHRAAGQAAIQASNPKVVKDKVGNI